MESLLQIISDRVNAAIKALGVQGDPVVRASQDAKFGDYQSNGAMALAKKLGEKPRDVAAKLVELIKIDDMCEPLEIAGPGFINFRLKNTYLADYLGLVPPVTKNEPDRWGLPLVSNPETVVIDLSSPNLAKEMHIGHLRSTVIGDCVARVLEFAGHTVHRENHVGDWGTQFGMLVAFLLRTKPAVVEKPDLLEIKDLESFYVEAKALFDRDDDFKTVSRETVVKLQQGDADTRRIWKAFCHESLRHCHDIYKRLGVSLIDRGESFYTDLMEEIIARLEKMMATHGDFVRISDGALCLFMDGFTTRDKEPLPMIVRKSDGGYNYATSDLATIVHRVETLQANRIIYVVGAPQKHHFNMLFAAIRQTGWVGDEVQFHHLAFGSVLDKSGCPFKTREGGTAKLVDVLDEAIVRARSVIDNQDKGPGKTTRTYSTGEADQIAERVGLAAVKYFDLSHSLTTDYRFDMDRMLSLEGNTAPYMLYAYARIRSIGRKAGVAFESLSVDGAILLEHPAEIGLAKTLARLPEVLELIARDLKPNIMTDYLADLAKSFNRFYDKKLGVRVIDATPEAVRTSRLRLCDLTARALKLGLYLLGIETVEQM